MRRKKLISVNPKFAGHVRHASPHPHARASYLEGVSVSLKGKFMEHVMTIRAYARKEEVGGGFRGLCIILPAKDRIESPVLDTYEAARHWSQVEAHKRMGSRPYRRASVAGRRGSYYANIWA